MSIVTPYIEEIDSWADFSNSVFCDYSPTLILENETPIKEVIARQPLIAQWWKTKPYQSIRRIDTNIALALLQGIVDINPNDLEHLGILIEALSSDTQRPPTRPVSKGANKPPPAQSAKIKPKALVKKKRWMSHRSMRLSWVQFEELVAEVFSHIHTNSTVKLTASRADQGVDVFITDDKAGTVQIVQCKRFRPDSRVSSVDMQKFAGAMKKFKAKKGYFVTSSSFNRYALEYIEGMDDIELIDNKKLVRMINDDDLIPSREEFQRA